MIKPTISIGNIPTSFLESMSFYESMLWMIGYIQKLEERIDEQDKDIQDAISYMKDNIQATTREIFEEYLNSGKIDVELHEEYDPILETLDLSISATPVDEE